MTLEQLQHWYEEYRQLSSPYDGTSEAASDVLLALSSPGAGVATLLYICEKQAETIATLRSVIDRHDVFAWGKAMEKLYVYAEFFHGLLDIQMTEVGGVYL